MSYCNVIVTFGTEKNAKKIIKIIIDKKYASCIQSQTVTSHYRWEGKIVHKKEIKCTIKTTNAMYDVIQKCVLEHHDYQNPEILQLPITNGSPIYLEWINDVTAESENSSDE